MAKALSITLFFGLKRFRSTDAANTFALTAFNLRSGVLISGKAEELPPKLKGKKDRLIAGSFKEGSTPALDASAGCVRASQTNSRILKSKKMFKSTFLFAVFQVVSSSCVSSLFVDVTNDRNVLRQTRKLCLIFSFSRNRKLLYLSLSTKFTAWCALQSLLKYFPAFNYFKLLSLWMVVYITC